MSAATLIELGGISRRFQRKGGASVLALRDVTLRLDAGEFVCITGPSGSGKSTLMHILGCLDSPDSGYYRLAGRDVSKLTADGLAWLRRRVFGFVFQSFHLLASATAVENVELPGYYAGEAYRARRRRALSLLAALGLEARTSHRPAALSGGEQQRVSIARALMTGGRVILADEPTGALDGKNGSDVLEVLEELARRGHTVVLTSHNPEVAARAGRRIELLDGRVVADSGPTARPRTRQAVTPGPAVAGVYMGAAARSLDVLQWGFASLRTNLLRTRRVRASLTVSCIALGVWSVATMLTIAEGAYQQGMEQLNRLGVDQIDVFPAGREDEVATPLTVDDAAAIAAQIPNVRLVAPSFKERMTVRYRAESMQAEVESLMPQEAAPPNGLESRVLAKGSAISARDNANREQLAVIGSGIEDELFPPGTSALGQHLMIGNVPFAVKGVLAAPDKARTWSSVRDDAVLIPFRTGASLLHGTDKPRWLSVFVDDPQKMGVTLAATRQLLIRRHGGAEFRFDFNPGRVEQAGETRRRLWLGFGSLGAIALLVGGLGVTAIMLMSVGERTGEIGIRMTFGARRRDIARQFVTEAAALSTVGGATGLIASVATTPLMGHLDMPTVFAPEIALAALAFSMGTGLASGILPARRASALDPVDALRAAA